MPLRIFHDDANYGYSAACAVLTQTQEVGPRHKYWIAGMGGFAVANNPHNETALATSGAGPCQIIIVHKGPGVGALGHYAAHWIVRGVSQMIKGLGGHPVANVVFAAGEIGDGATQQKYQQTILDWVRRLCPGARVRWPAGGPWDAAYYLPLAEEIALFDGVPDGGDWNGSGDPQSGVTGYDYPFTALPPALPPARPRRLSLTPPPTPPPTRSRRDSV